MRSMHAAILAVFLVTALTAAAGAQVPDPNLSTVVLDPENAVAGLTTCPAGDAPPFEYIKITCIDAMGVPIPGLPASNFAFLVAGGSVTFDHAPFGAYTDPNGDIYFSVVGNHAIPHPSMGGLPLAIAVNYLGVPLGQPVGLPCTTMDYDLDGDVDPVDFVIFAGDWNTVAPRSDFTWSGGPIDPFDFRDFANHFGH